jgi:hypothetical protein
MRETSREGMAQAVEASADTEQLAAALAAWRQSLESAKKSIDEATAAVGVLNATLREMAPLWHSVEQLQKALTDVDLAEAMDEATAAAEEALAKATALRPPLAVVSEEAAAPELEEPETETAQEAVPTFASPVRPPARLDVPISGGGAPYSYTVTVEEVGSRVKLVPLHQSLSQVDGIRELSLRSYTNGVAVVSIDSEIELEAQALQEALGAGMNQACRVMSGEGPSFLARLGGDAASARRHQPESVK